ncbi:MAG TPA: histidine phosphatase family protein [Acidimicrobiia bacterium]|nr:histidine phosphatase family protein [Acidimicrobiia bacterium]
MKTILLMRHAKSDWDASYVSDHDRPLAARGHRSAAVMGRVLAAWEEIPDLVITSSAARARATAEEAARAGSWDCPIIVDPDLYGTGPGTVLAVAERDATDQERMMLVGHEPTWSMLAEQITGGRVEMRTAGVAAIDLLADTWDGLDQARGWLRFVVNPRMFFGSEWDRDEIRGGSPRP